MLHGAASQLSLCAVTLRGSAALVCREVRRSEGTFAQLHSAGAPPDGVSCCSPTHNVVVGNNIVRVLLVRGMQRVPLSYGSMSRGFPSVLTELDYDNAVQGSAGWHEKYAGSSLASI